MSLTASELIAVEALLELHTHVRVNNNNNGDIKVIEVVEIAEPIPSCSGVSNGQALAKVATKKLEVANLESRTTERGDSLPQPSTSRQTFKRKSSHNRPALYPKRIKLYKRPQARARRTKTRSVGSQSEGILQLATLDAVQYLLMRLYSKVESWFAQIQASQDSSEDDEEEEP